MRSFKSRSFSISAGIMGLAVTGVTAVIGVALPVGCSVDRDSAGDTDPNGGVVRVDMQLQIAPGLSVNTVSWTIANATTGFTRSGSVNVRFSNTVRFQVGGVPAAAGYTITLNAVTADGSFTCVGSATFSVSAGATTNANVNLSCSPAAPDAGNGTVVVTGTTEICGNIDAISVSPLETTVNNPISLVAVASAGSVTPTFAWTATAGTFDNAASPNAIFTCPPTPGLVTLTLTIAPGSATCTTITSQSVTVTCDTLNPTFTNVYANVISQRCISCHRPGGGGVNVGLLDMSTPAAAYANLVGVPAQGIGAGTSGVTCSSLSPALTRVVPNNSAASLIFNKVNSKLEGVLPPCGSPMPTPATAVPLTAAQVSLIRAWIDAGALNN